MEPPGITQLLMDWRNGDQTALNSLLLVVYPELHKRAEQYFRRERPGHVLQPTALVNEVFLKLVKQDRVPWEGRAHFFAICARMMRQILIDYFRKYRLPDDVDVLPLKPELVVAPERAKEFLLLDEALIRLEKFDERKSKVIEHHYFGGMTAKESAEVLGVSPNTVLLDREFARAWLQREMEAMASSGR